MERKVVAVCAVVGFLGVLSAALGFAAEATRVKVRLAASPFFCASAAAGYALCRCCPVLLEYSTAMVLPPPTPSGRSRSLLSAGVLGGGAVGDWAHPSAGEPSRLRYSSN